MNIYLLEQSENKNYEAFGSCVVLSETAEDAVKISPAHGGTLKYADAAGYFLGGRGDRDHFATWAGHVSDVRCTLLGVADASLGGRASPVLIASYNVG